MEGIAAEKIISWVDNNLPPFSWNFIKIGVCKPFVLHGINITDVTNDTIIPDVLVDTIKEKIKERYDVDMVLDHNE